MSELIFLNDANGERFIVGIIQDINNHDDRLRGFESNSCYLKAHSDIVDGSLDSMFDDLLINNHCYIEIEIADSIFRLKPFSVSSKKIFTHGMVLIEIEIIANVTSITKAP